MAKRGAPGLGVQVAKALKAINGRGISKHDTKMRYQHEKRAMGEKVSPLESPLIHSDNYRQNIYQTSTQFLRFAREQGLGAGLIRDFQMEEAGRKWFEHRINQGIKDLRTEAGHLRKLESGIKEAWGVEVKIVPDDLTQQLRAVNYPTTRAQKIALQEGYRRYTPEELIKCIEHVAGQRRNGLKKSQALMGQARLGLRLQEAVCLRTSHVDLERNRIYICEGQKGTRTRFVPIPKDYQPVLEKLVSGKSATDRVFDVPGKNLKSQMRGLQRSWQRACKANGIEETKTHNLRAFYACERLEELKNEIHSREPALDEKQVDDAARKVLIEEMGHSDTAKLAHYIR